MDLLYNPNPKKQMSLFEGMVFNPVTNRVSEKTSASDKTGTNLILKTPNFQVTMATRMARIIRPVHVNIISSQTSNYKLTGWFLYQQLPALQEKTRRFVLLSAASASGTRCSLTIRCRKDYTVCLRWHVSPAPRLFQTNSVFWQMFGAALLWL